MWLSDILTSKRSKLRRRAELLLPAAKVVGVSTFTTLLDKFPGFSSVSTKDWDFFFPIAAVFTATIGLDKPMISDKLKTELGIIYGRSLDQWSNNWNEAFKDCSDFFWCTAEALRLSNEPEYTQSPKFRISDPVGMWLLWNLLGKAPKTDEERKLARAIGLLVTEEFINWWV